MFFIVLIGCLSAGCAREDTEHLDCVESVLNENGMVPYDGQEIGCKDFLHLFHHNNKQYFVFGNHCADMISHPFNCEGKSPGGILSFSFDRAENKGIVGIRE